MLAALYMFAIMIRAFVSWLREDIIYRYAGFFRFVNKITNPLIYFIRKYLPSVYRNIDFSPVIAIFFIYAAKTGIILLLERI